MLTPFVFCLLVGVLAIGKGFISQFLSAKPFQELGMLSYSIYMNHSPFTGMVLGLFHQAIKKQIFTDYILTPGGEVSYIFGQSMLHGVFYLFIILAGLVGMSYGTYYGIEKPCREWTRRKLEKVK